MLAFKRCFASFPLLLLVRLLNVLVLKAKFGEYLPIIGPPRYSGKDDQVLGRFIPAGTTVACPTYTLHRDCNSSDFFDGLILTPVLQPATSEIRMSSNQSVGYLILN